VIRVNAIALAFEVPGRPVSPVPTVPVKVVAVQTPEILIVDAFIFTAVIIPVELMINSSLKLTFCGKEAPFENSTGPVPEVSVILLTRSTDITLYSFLLFR
jgi:hypothetical protein